jgi:hypothetical protein
LDKYGVPHYLKLSLHGEEDFCLADLKPGRAPAYLSLQMPTELTRSERVLEQLTRSGYQRFKIIDQRTQTQLNVSHPSFKTTLRRSVKQHPALYGLCSTMIARAKRLLRSRQQPAPNDAARAEDALIQWVFPMGSSGPFGEQTHGSWQSADTVHAAWKAFVSGEMDEAPHDTSIWHDLHATQLG